MSENLKTIHLEYTGSSSSSGRKLTLDRQPPYLPSNELVEAVNKLFT